MQSVTIIAGEHCRVWLFLMALESFWQNDGHHRVAGVDCDSRKSEPPLIRCILHSALLEINIFKF